MPARSLPIHVAENAMTIDLGGDGTHAIRRTTTQPVRSIKALAVHQCSRPSLPSWLVNSVQVREAACLLCDLWHL
jgi:hypothetical protein